MSGYRWLILRRASQFGILALFLIGPWFGLWWVKGNLNYSLSLGWLPLTDPHLLLQSAAAGQMPPRLALIGALITVAVYLVVGGRSYCAWVCPVNPLTDAAHWLRRRLGLKGGAQLKPQTRYWMLAMTLVLAAASADIAWEMINPVSMTHRGLIFGMGAAWAVAAGVFLFDLLAVQRGWCGHLCPAGALYSLIGRFSLLRIRLPARQACDDCMDCYAVCPEPQVIRPALKAVGGAAPIILQANCTNCGRCIDVCTKRVFAFGIRLNPRSGSPS